PKGGGAPAAWAPRSAALGAGTGPAGGSSAGSPARSSAAAFVMACSPGRLCQRRRGSWLPWLWRGLCPACVSCLVARPTRGGGSVARIGAGDTTIPATSGAIAALGSATIRRTTLRRDRPAAPGVPHRRDLRTRGRRRDAARADVSGAGDLDALNKPDSLGIWERRTTDNRMKV